MLWVKFGLSAVLALHYSVHPQESWRLSSETLLRECRNLQYYLLYSYLFIINYIGDFGVLIDQNIPGYQTNL